jgi:hypothetical protein
MLRRSLGLVAILLLCSCCALTEWGAAPTPTPADAALFIPDGAHLLHQASGDLDADGRAEYVIVAGFGSSPQRLGFDWLQLFVIEPDRGAERAVSFQSEPLAGDRAEKLWLMDINGDGYSEVLSVQSMGASGETLHVLAWRDKAFAFLRPQGGRFDGQDRFGDNGVRVEDVDGDGMPEIFAHYGPAAAHSDVYHWDGSNYVYVETRSEQ